MDTKTQAQKGFKTFMLTLVVSLFVFSAIYVVLNRTSSDAAYTASAQPLNETSSVSGTQNGDTTAAESSVFGELASAPSDVQPRAVLAAGDSSDLNSMLAASSGTGVGDTAPQSTVPVTGVSGPTAGLLISTTLFGIVGYMLVAGPRRLALSSFERRVLKDLE